MAAVDYFLKIDGIPGESQDARHKDEIDLESFAWSEANAANVTGGGAGGRVSMHDFTFTMRLNKASPLLMLAAASGKHLNSAVLTARGAGARADQEFLVITLTNALVSAYTTETADAEDGYPRDVFSLGFERIVIDYRPRKVDGTLDAAIRFGWDVKANQPV